MDTEEKVRKRQLQSIDYVKNAFNAILLISRKTNRNEQTGESLCTKKKTTQHKSATSAEKQRTFGAVFLVHKQFTRTQNSYAIE